MLAGYDEMPAEPIEGMLESDDALMHDPRTVLRDPSVRALIESGLIVTYCRPFLSGEMPIDQRLVPAHDRELHEALMRRRHFLDAHTRPAKLPPELRRTVRWSPDAEGDVYELSTPRMTPHELRSIASHAGRILKEVLKEMQAKGITRSQSTYVKRARK